MALEYNPLSRAQNPLLELSTTLQSLKKDLVRMLQDIRSEVTHLVLGETTDLISAVQERIRQNIEAIVNMLSRKPAAEVRLLNDLFARADQVQLLGQLLNPNTEEDVTSEKQVLVYLARINQALYQIASKIKVG
jgi:hypothetical protein